ncbi:hypothetical protein XELAEV_18029326mg [Xenopus laevis]|uniref:Uncharacterized protein n=1 Tax=Xenopus laevis TaxID=8355 RepID=A0A974CRA9_XENLA|nr:hypothetical protein XELAEV_18029326mg [Xenopus laevis]
MAEQFLQTVKVKDRDLLRDHIKTKKEGQRMVFVSRYTTASRHASKMIIKHWQRLQNCVTHIPQFRELSLMAYNLYEETTQKVKDCISKHKTMIHRNITTLPVPQHFPQAKHSISQLKFQVNDMVDRPRRGGERLLQLKYCEMYWIHKLDMVWPRGLNRE